jgi:hypothetical protein
VRKNYLRLAPGEGFLIALAIGLLVAVLLERAKPRAVDGRQVRALTGHAVVDVSCPEDVDALAVRLLKSSAARTVVLPATDELTASARRLAEELRASTASLRAAGNVAVHREATPIDDELAGSLIGPDECVLVVATPSTSLPRLDGTLDAVGLGSDVCVAVVHQSRGARAVA